MSQLTGKTPAQTYKDLIQVSNNNTGIDSILRQVSDGQGDDSPLYLSISKVQLRGSNAVFEVANSSGTVLFEVDTTANTITAKSGVSFTGDGSGLTGVLSAGVGGASSTGNLEMISDSGSLGSGDLIFKIGTVEVFRIPHSYADSLPTGIAGNYVLKTVADNWAEPDVGVSYNGIDQYSLIADDPNLDLSNSFTLEFYVKSSLSSYTDAPLMINGSDGYNKGCRLVYTTSGKFNIQMGSGSSNLGNLFSNANSYTTNFQHIIVVNSKSGTTNTITYYIDGVKNNSGTITGDLGYGTDDRSTYLSPVGKGGLPEVFKGIISKAKIYNRALTEEEVIARWNNGKPFEFVEPYEMRRASQAALTSGTLEVGKSYSIDLLLGTDDFQNVGGKGRIGTNGILNLSGNYSRTSASDNAYNALIAAGWTITL